LAQEEEYALMVLEWEAIHFEVPSSVGGEILNVSTHPSTPFPMAAMGAAVLYTTTPSPVHLVEEKVFAQFSDGVKKEGCRWVLEPYEWRPGGVCRDQLKHP
jgi:hypothetical protein